MGFEHAGKVLETDEEGYLVHFEDWSVDVAQAMARAQAIELTASHWEVLNFLRDYYREYHTAPAVRILVRAIGKRLGPEKANTKYLYQLFPFGPAKQACKIAGLPKPTGCV